RIPPPQLRPEKCPGDCPSDCPSCRWIHGVSTTRVVAGWSCLALQRWLLEGGRPRFILESSLNLRVLDFQVGISANRKEMVDMQARVCSACRAAMPAGARFCGDCGGSLNQPPAPATSGNPADPSLALLLPNREHNIPGASPPQVSGAPQHGKASAQMAHAQQS